MLFYITYTRLDSLKVRTLKVRMKIEVSTRGVFLDVITMRLVWHVHCASIWTGGCCGQSLDSSSSRSVDYFVRALCDKAGEIEQDVAENR